MTKEGEKPTEESVATSKLEGVDFLATRVKQLERENKGLRGQLGKRKAESSPEAPPEPENKPPEAPPKHFVHNSDRYCTDCGGPNPEFKDETKCDGCGQSLGSIKGMVSLKACPNCGATSFTPKRKLTEEEQKLFVK